MIFSFHFHFPLVQPDVRLWLRAAARPGSAPSRSRKLAREWRPVSFSFLFDVVFRGGGGFMAIGSILICY